MNFTGSCYVAILFLTEFIELIILQNTTEYQEILKQGYLESSREKNFQGSVFMQNPCYGIFPYISELISKTKVLFQQNYSHMTKDQINTTGVTMNLTVTDHSEAGEQLSLRVHSGCHLPLPFIGSWGLTDRPVNFFKCSCLPLSVKCTQILGF